MFLPWVLSAIKWEGIKRILYFIQTSLDFKEWDLPFHSDSSIPARAREKKKKKMKTKTETTIIFWKVTLRFKGWFASLRKQTNKQKHICLKREDNRRLKDTKSHCVGAKEKKWGSQRMFCGTRTNGGKVKLRLIFMCNFFWQKQDDGI